MGREDRMVGIDNRGLGLLSASLQDFRATYVRMCGVGSHVPTAGGERRIGTPDMCGYVGCRRAGKPTSIIWQGCQICSQEASRSCHVAG